MRVTGTFTLQPFCFSSCFPVTTKWSGLLSHPTMLPEAWSTGLCDHRLNPPANINLFHCLEDLTQVFCYSTKN